MKVCICEDYNEMSVRAAELVAYQIAAKPNCVLGLATGSTPVGLYENLIKMENTGEVDFSGVTTFNLDEYYPISPENPQSYRYFMNERLFSRVSIDIERTHIPNGMTEDPAEECLQYEKLIDEAGGIDVQILGIGQNGHIGFNEPDEELAPYTHITDLTPETILANSRFFESEAEMPRQALTMGVESIFKARSIIILANGEAKAEAVRCMLSGNITPKCPASFLRLHPDVTLICDKQAARLL